ncbi:MAG: hypothetical protein ACRC6X_03745 [Culicoidibacterales bacterium]
MSEEKRKPPRWLYEIPKGVTIGHVEITEEQKEWVRKTKAENRAREKNEKK